MAETGRRDDPLRGFRFQVVVTGLATGGFTECTGLSVQTDVKEYAEGGLNSHVRTFPGRATQSRLVLKRGIVDRALHDWFWDIVGGTIVRRSGSVVILDEQGARPVAEWRWPGALPRHKRRPAPGAGHNTDAAAGAQHLRLSL